MTLPPALAAALGDLDRDGFAVLRGWFGPDDVARMARGFDRLLAMARAGDTGNTGHSDAGARFVVDHDPFRLHRVVWCGAAAPELALGDHPRFLEVAAAALGQPDLVQLIQQAHFKLPGDEVAFRWHQDASNRRYGTEFTDVQGTGSYLQLTVAIDPMTADNGPLRMVPGSHRLGFVAHPTTGDLPDEVLADAEPVDVLLEPGDMAIFGPFVVHGSAPNRSSQPRRLFLQGYTVPGANRRVYPGCGTGIARRAPRPLRMTSPAA
mgnify:CR=1 FL=1